MTSRKAFSEQTSNRIGVPISDEYSTNSNTFLSTRYAEAGVARGTNTVLDANYINKAFGNGRNENQYKNNYKGKFDNRYPSIWRKPVAVNFVRGLDDWERAALSAALGVPWTPPPPPPPLLVYGPFLISFDLMSGGANFNSGENYQLYIAITSDNERTYFAKESNDNLHQLTISADTLSIDNVKSIETLTFINNLVNSESTPISDNNIINNIRLILNLPAEEETPPPEGEIPPPEEETPPPEGEIPHTEGETVNNYITRFSLTNTTGNYPIYYNGAVFYISYTDNSEYQIGSINANDSATQAYFIRNNEQEIFDIIDNNNELANFTQLRETVSILNNMESIPFDNLNIIPLSAAIQADIPSTGGKYKKNKNKSRRFKKHFRKTRKSHKE